MYNNKAPRSIITVSLFTGLSRLLGLIRDMLFSRVIGISYVADAFFIALRIPNIFRRITSEGAFSASFIPIFSRDFSENKNKSINFAESVLFYMITTITLLVLLAQILMPLLIYLLAGGFSENQINQKTFHLHNLWKLHQYFWKISQQLSDQGLF